MHIAVINNHTMHLTSIKQLFSPYDTIQYISYTQVGGYDFSTFDCVLLTGSSNHPHYSKRFKKEIELLQKLQKPLIGICMGCELLIEAFGGIIARNKDRIQGDTQIYCERVGRSYKVYEAHRYAVISLSSELQGLAKSDYGYEIIRHKTKPILGFQFHPEIMHQSKDGYNLFQEYISSILPRKLPTNKKTTHT